MHALCGKLVRIVLLPGLAVFGSVFRAGDGRAGVENADTQTQSAISPQCFFLFLRPTMNESCLGEINHQQPAVCSLAKASERFGLMNTAWPLTARAVLQSLPDRPTALTSQNKSPQS